MVIIRILIMNSLVLDGIGTKRSINAKSIAFISMQSSESDFFIGLRFSTINVNYTNKFKKKTEN